MTKQKTSFSDYLKIFSKAKGVFGPELEKENRRIREEAERALGELRDCFLKKPKEDL